jgi:hypothetical protein
LLAVAVKRSWGNIVNRVETEHNGGRRESEMTVHCSIWGVAQTMLSPHTRQHTHTPTSPKLNLSSLVKLLFQEMFQRFVFRVGRNKLGP